MNFHSDVNEQILIESNLKWIYILYILYGSGLGLFRLDLACLIRRMAGNIFWFGLVRYFVQAEVDVISSCKFIHFLVIFTTRKSLSSINIVKFNHNYALSCPCEVST